MRDEYDVDDDGRLDGSEALSLLWDLWRLVVASRDATAWYAWLACAQIRLTGSGAGGSD